MTKEEIYEIQMMLCDDMQKDTPMDANAEQLRYLMAYNDGVLAMAKEVLKLIKKKQEADKEVDDVPVPGQRDVK